MNQLPCRFPRAYPDLLPDPLLPDAIQPRHRHLRQRLASTLESLFRTQP
jgi:hypothetical protein